MSTATTKKPRENLTQKVIGQIKSKIDSGTLKVGDKLPTEQKLIIQLGVSRTVIREAIASLKAAGLVQPKHGVGVFVTEPQRSTQKLNLLLQNSKTISDTIEALELRLAVEVESAGLAAIRCSPAQEAEIFDCYYAFKDKKNAHEHTEAEDFNFHVAIAKATNNQHYVDFLTLLGNKIIPRARIQAEAGIEPVADIDERLDDEHQAIVEAIADRDPERAKNAMRNHLSGGAKRYKALARLIQRKQMTQNSQ
jgi:DNA-binding FadR family transcriptional regulator